MLARDGRSSHQRTQPDIHKKENVMVWRNRLAKFLGGWRLWSTAVLGSVMVCGASEPVFAHARQYAFNEQYQTLPKGIFEIESNTTVKVLDMGKHSGENSWTYQEELEYGLTDHWNIAHYQQWGTENKEGVDDDGVPNKDITRYAGFKFETKYRIGEKGKYWVDPLLYFEYEYDSRDRKEGAPNVLEGKIVLSRDFGKWNAVYNQILESRLGHKGRTEHEFTLGLNYELLSGFRPGVEVKGQYWNPGSNRNELAIGPSLAYEAKYFWIAASVLFGANNAANDFQASLRFGIPIG